MVMVYVGARGHTLLQSPKVPYVTIPLIERDILNPSLSLLPLPLSFVNIMYGTALLRVLQY